VLRAVTASLFGRGLVPLEGPSRTQCSYSLLFPNRLLGTCHQQVFDGDDVRGIGKTGLPPRSKRRKAAAVTLATATRLRGRHSNSNSSTASNTAASGASKVADIPAEGPATSNTDRSASLIFSNWASNEPAAPPVACIGDSLYQASFARSVNQFHRAVVAQHHTLGDVRNRNRKPDVCSSRDHLQELVMLRVNPPALGSSFAERKKVGAAPAASSSVPRVGKAFFLLIAMEQVHRSTLYVPARAPKNAGARKLTRECNEKVYFLKR
jgi:hypothetical protein